MKKSAFAIACMSFVALSCTNNNTSGDNTTDDTTNNMFTGGDTVDALNTNTQAVTTPFNSQDSAFVMKAATGGLMEVESGNLALQKGNHQRVKDYGAMMVADHGRANSELKSLVANRLMIPDSLPADMRKHMDQMQKMSGRAFDNHYINMMVEDHRKTIDLFTKQSQNGTDPQLKNWAAATLPVLQKHYDSVQAIKKGLK